MKDKYKKYRKKSRYILELRYPPLVNIFDKRGEILNEIYPIFKPKLDQWKVDNAQVIMADSFKTPTKQIVIGHLRSSIMYEDASTLQEFVDDSNKLLKELKKFFPELDGLDRVGFRIISIFDFEIFSSFQEVSKKIQETFLVNPFPSQIDFTDLKITLMGEQFGLNIGPVKEGEPWAISMFSNPIKNIPKYGLGIDVDGYANDVNCSTEIELINVINKIQALTFSIEDDLLNRVLQ